MSSKANRRPLSDSTDNEDDDTAPFNPSKIVRDFARRWAKKALSEHEHTEEAHNLHGDTDNNKIRQRLRLGSWSPAPSLQFLENNKKKGREFIDKKRNELERKMKDLPFIRTVDKVAFTLGVVLMVVTALHLDTPQWMYILYTGLIFPLLILRFALYHRNAYHYFMLDFCYYCQVFLLIYLYYYPDNALVFQLVFCMSNGPLLSAIVMWKNSLVFHDLDKITSMFIHIYPPIVTFCLRWMDSGKMFTVCKDEQCSIGFSASFVWPLIMYTFWQFCYILKTEVLDRSKFKDNEDLMTSVRWFSKARPHPVYKFLLSKGVKTNPVVLLIAIQFLYTIVTLLPTILLYKYYEAHVVYLTFVSLVAVWNGANYYFEVFTHSYAERLKRITEEINQQVAAADGKAPDSPEEKPDISIATAAAVAKVTAEISKGSSTTETLPQQTTTGPDAKPTPKKKSEKKYKYWWQSWASFFSFWFFFVTMFVLFCGLLRYAVKQLDTD